MNVIAFWIGLILLFGVLTLSDHYDNQDSIECMKAGGTLVKHTCRAATPASGTK